MACIGLPAPGIAAEPEPDGDEEALRHALSLYETQQYAEAIMELKAVYVAHPRPEILYMLGQAYRLDGNCASAIKAYRSFLRSEPPPRQVKATREQIKNCRRLLAEAAAGEEADSQPVGATDATTPPAETSAPVEPTPREDVARAGRGEAAESSDRGPASSGTDSGPASSGTDSGPASSGTDSGPASSGTDSGSEAVRTDLGPVPLLPEAQPLWLTDRLGTELLIAGVATLGASAAFGVAEKVQVDASASAANYGDFDRSYRSAQDARRVWPWLLGSGAVLLIAGLVQQFVIAGPRAAEETIGVSGPGGSVLCSEPY